MLHLNPPGLRKMAMNNETAANMPPGPQRQEHMACSDPTCPTFSDPYTGRFYCRCYTQLPESRDQTLPPMSTSPGQTPGYPNLYSTPYGIEAATSLQAAAMGQTGGRWDPSMLPPGAGYPSPYAHPAPPSNPMDNILRSQMYNYMYPMMDLNGARRKNATRETTSALKAWLKDHRKNPYPTKAEKIMLAIVTKMTLTQVSTWFANARRRLKKETRDGSGDSLDTSTTSSDDDRLSSVGEIPEQEVRSMSSAVPRLDEEMPRSVVTSTPKPVLPGITTFSQLKPDDFMNANSVPYTNANNSSAPYTNANSSSAPYTNAINNATYNNTTNQTTSSATNQLHYPTPNYPAPIDPNYSPHNPLSNMTSFPQQSYFKESEHYNQILNPLATANFPNGLNGVSDTCETFKPENFLPRTNDNKSLASDGDDSDKENVDVSRSSSSGESLPLSGQELKPKRSIWSISEIIAPRDLMPPLSDASSDCTSECGSEGSSGSEVTL